MERTHFLFLKEMKYAFPKSNKTTVPSPGNQKREGIAPSLLLCVFAPNFDFAPCPINLPIPSGNMAGRRQFRSLRRILCPLGILQANITLAGFQFAPSVHLFNDGENALRNPIAWILRNQLCIIGETSNNIACRIGFFPDI